MSGFFSTAEEEGAATDAVDKKEEEPLEGETVEPEPAEEPEKKDEDGTKLGKEEETVHPETKSDNATENTSAQVQQFARIITYLSSARKCYNKRGKGSGSHRSKAENNRRVFGCECPFSQ